NGKIRSHQATVERNPLPGGKIKWSKRSLPYIRTSRQIRRYAVKWKHNTKQEASSMNSKTHWLPSIVAVTFLVVGGLLLTNAVARQKHVSRQAAVAEPVQAATLPPASPIYTNGNFTFSTPQALIR